MLDLSLNKRVTISEHKERNTFEFAQMRKINLFSMHLLKARTDFNVTGSEQVEKTANNNGIGSAISKLICTSFFAVVSMFISFNGCL